jgi:prepilin-type N-terminal cleavage/methylation domain-containing protein
MRNQKGYTLIELIAVMVMISIMGAVVTKKATTATRIADQTVITSVSTTLNSQELMVWGGVLVSGKYKDDRDVWSHKEEILEGNGVTFVSVSQTGATVEIGGSTVTLIREPSTQMTSGRWVKPPPSV